MTADQIVDRRRLRRKLTFWRVIAFLALLAVGAAVVLYGDRDRFALVTTPQIARVSISGFITVDRAQTDLLEALAGNDAVRGVIVAIDSTGGVTAGGEALYEELRKLADAKPTVAALGTVGASAAYMAALAADHIVARRTTITGSIGVIYASPEVSGLLDKLGVAVTEVKTGPLKAEPSPYQPTTEEARAVVAGVIGDSFDWFVDIVAERRGMPRGQALALADGRIFSGRQALDADLIDAIGGEDAALAWLNTQGVDTDLPIRDWRPDDGPSVGWWFGNAVVGWVVQAIGFSPDGAVGGVLNRILPENLMLDGLMSVWQGSGSGDA